MEKSSIYDKIFNNSYLIEHIFNYLPNKLSYLNINHTINNYLFNHVPVYFPSNNSPNNSITFENRISKLNEIHINHFNYLIVELIYNPLLPLQNQLNSTTYLSNHLINYLAICPDNINLSTFFPTVKKLFLKSPYYTTFNLIHLSHLVYLNSYNTRISNLPIKNLQTLIVDCRNLPLKESFTHLKHLKILSLKNSSYNYEKFIISFSQNLSLFPSLKTLYLDFFIYNTSHIILTNLTHLENVFTHNPSLIITHSNTICHEINSYTNDFSNTYFI